MRIINKLCLVLVATLTLIGRAWGAPTLAGYTNCSNASILTCNTADSLPGAWSWQPGDHFVAIDYVTGSAYVAATCNASQGFSLIGTATGLGGGNATATLCEKVASTEAATENPISAISSGFTSWGGQMFVVRANGTIKIDQFKGTSGNGLSGGSQVLNGATTLYSDELALYVYSGNANNIALSGTGLSSVATGNALAVATSVQPTAGALPQVTATGTSTGGNSEGMILTFYVVPGSATPTPTSSATATPTPIATPSPTATATPSPTPSPTPAPVSSDCINPNITFRSETATNNTSSIPTTITLPKPTSAFGDRQFIYLLSSDRNPILPDQGNNLGPALGATTLWQSIDSLWEPTTIANNVWYYDPGVSEPPFIAVNSPTSEGEDFIATIDLKASCGKFGKGEYGRSVGITGSNNSISSPAITTSHYGEMCVVFGADDFANNQVSFANTPPGFVSISDPQLPPPVAIGYFPMTIPGAVPSFNLNSAGTSGTLVMQVVCPWAN